MGAAGAAPPLARKSREECAPEPALKVRATQTFGQSSASRRTSEIDQARKLGGQFVQATSWIATCRVQGSPTCRPTRKSESQLTEPKQPPIEARRRPTAPPSWAIPTTAPAIILRPQLAPEAPEQAGRSNTAPRTQATGPRPMGRAAARWAVLGRPADGADTARRLIADWSRRWILALEEKRRVKQHGDVQQTKARDAQEPDTRCS
jgi:hypothetical protein